MCFSATHLQIEHSLQFSQHPSEFSLELKQLAAYPSHSYCFLLLVGLSLSISCLQRYEEALHNALLDTKSSILQFQHLHLSQHLKMLFDLASDAKDATFRIQHRQHPQHRTQHPLHLTQHPWNLTQHPQHLTQHPSYQHP